MSRRHIDSKVAKAGSAARPHPSKWARRTAARKARHDTREALATVMTVDDGDALVLPPDSHRNGVADGGIVPVPDVAEVAEPTPRFRVWKTKSWKRRTNDRLSRARAEQALVRDDDLETVDETHDRGPDLQGVLTAAH